ncbi:Eukaryotic translation initiation factor 5A-4 [Triticum urartu]|uniref:Eukaryotic translation initiation factor 5A-4 n=1 Tax=Triticum urartu TaxID=4572 RepID=M7ZUE6_TRIUA|nr:Eukaryotic translation initiation factor 5A-4 [Triticum urartu]
MSDSEEHQFESKADAGASKTYPQQAGTIRKNGYIVIKNRPCKVVEVSTSKTGKHGHAKCHFVAIDIFTGKKLEDIVPSSHNCDVPHVNRTEYQLIDISEDGFVSLLTDNGNTKDDLKLPTDETLLGQIKDGFAEGKDLVVSVMSAMGEEQINALKDIGPNVEVLLTAGDTTAQKDSGQMSFVANFCHGEWKLRWFDYYFITLGTKLLSVIVRVVLYGILTQGVLASYGSHDEM